jgi:hypothetical protein
MGVDNEILEWYSKQFCKECYRLVKKFVIDSGDIRVLKISDDEHRRLTERIFSEKIYSPKSMAKRFLKAAQSLCETDVKEDTH